MGASTGPGGGRRRRGGGGGGGLGRVGKFLVCLGACNCLLLGGCMWWIVSSGGGGRSDQKLTVSHLKARIRELESSAAAMMGGGGGAGGAAPRETALGDIPCDGCDLAQSAELNRRFNFFVLNLDRRPDKMACVRKQFARYGINVRRMPGLDSLAMDIPHLTLLPPTVKAFLKNNPGQSGHVGCLYGHVRFFMGAASGDDGCGAENKDLMSDESGNHDDRPIMLTFRNRWSKPVELLWIRADGKEERVGDWVAPGDARTVSTMLLHAWRVREQGSTTQLSQFKLDHHQTPSSAYTMNAERTLAHAFVFGCPPQDESLLHGSGQAADNNKISIIFEDDVVLREDFADKLLWSFDQMRKKQEPWDIFLLNWYCNSGHWKECDKNKGTLAVSSKPFDARDRGLYSYTSGLGAYSLPRVKYFMSGGAYAVSTSGARKLLNTFPCDK
jgi:GR25 family glycosyltransferase involved in LPS biosynthesis